MGEFGYSVGNPTNLVGGAAINFADIRESFADFDTWIDAANLDASNLSASYFAPYRTLFSGTGAVSPAAAGNYFLVSTSGDHHTQVANIGTTDLGPVVVGLDPADYAIAGRTPKLRLRTLALTNSVSTGINFTFSLNPLSASGSVISVGSAVTTITKNAPATSSVFVDTTADFSIPSAGFYGFVVNYSGAMAVNSQMNLTWCLQVHWI